MKRNYDPNKYPEITWKELEGEEYEILEVGQEYTIVRFIVKINIVFD